MTTLPVSGPDYATFRDDIVRRGHRRCRVRSSSGTVATVLMMGLSLYCSPVLASPSSGGEQLHQEKTVSSDDNRVQKPATVHAEDYISSGKKLSEEQLHLKSIDGSLAFCGTKNHMRERLSCYEDVARGEGVDIVPVVSDEGKNVHRGYKWSSKSGFDLQQKTIVISGIETDNVVDSFNPTDDSPSHAFLNIRCREGQKDLYFSYEKELVEKVKNGAGQMVYPTKPVNVRINIGGNEQVYPFMSATSGHSVGLWGGEHSSPVIEYLMNYAANNSNPDSHMTFTVSLENNHYITSTFSTNDMYEKIENLEKNCQKK